MGDEPLQTTSEHSHNPAAAPTVSYVGSSGENTGPERVPAPATPPVAVPGYEILGVLGRGGMGVVYKARHLALGRVVALKMILAGGHADAGDLARFGSEAEAVARLQHPNIVQIFEVGAQEGRPYFALEFVEGGSLAAKLDGTPWNPRDAAVLVETLARAIHAAHQQHVVHRDLKPANVLLTADGAPKVTDFGLAKKLDADDGMSRTGAVMGTPSYMPPEQASGKTREVGPAADVYALGAILYELLTGRPQFRGPTVLDTLQQVLTDEPAPPRRLQSKIPVDLETVCLKCLEKQAARRYGTALELGEELRRFLAGEPVRARPVGAVERATKWAKRRPALAAAYGFLLAALVLGLGGGGATWLWLGAESARSEADAARHRAETAEGVAKEAKRQLTQYSYADRVSLAQREWDAGQVMRARKLLQEAADLQEELTPARRPWEWEYLNRAFHPELAVLEGHTSGIDSVVFSPDGHRVATAGFDGARLWDADTGKQLTVLEGQTLSVAFSPDGRRVATAGWDSKARLWDATTGKSLTVLQGHTSGVTSVAFSPDGRRVATASMDGTARLWEAKSGQLLAILNHTFLEVHSVAFSPDGRRIATAGDDRTTRLWDAETGKQLAVLQDEMGVTYVAFSPDGRTVATVAGAVTLWDARTGKQLTILQLHNLATILQRGPSGICSIAFSPDGSCLATAETDGTARLWGAATGQPLAVLKGHTGAVNSVAFSPDGSHVATAGIDGTARLWDVTSDKHLVELIGAGGIFTSVAFSPEGGRIATASWDKTARLWDAASGKQLVVLQGHRSIVESVAFSPDGGRVATAGIDGTARLWDAASGKQLVVLVGHTSGVNSVAFSPAGDRVATASGDGTARFWEVISGKPITVLKRHTLEFSSVAFSPDGSRLATASWDKTEHPWEAALWDAASGTQLLVLEGHTSKVNSVAFSPDGSRVATASDDHTARLWDAASGKQLVVLEGHTSGVESAAFSPDGSRVATGSKDETARLWDAASGKQLIVLQEPKDGVLSVAFSPDGGRIATASLGASWLWIARENPHDREKRGHFWREQQAAEAEKGGHWFAAAFHLSRLIDADPANTFLYGRRSRAYVNQGLWMQAAVDLFLEAASTPAPDQPIP